MGRQHNGKDPLLVKKSDNEYELSETGDSVWVTVGNISVYIKRGDEGVSVDLYPLGREDGECSLASTWMLFSEAEEVQDAE